MNPPLSSSGGSDKWLVVPKNRDELLSVTRDLITEVRELSDQILKLQKLQGSEELKEKLDEVLNEIDCQFDKIILTIHTSEMVHTHLKHLRATIEQIYNFFHDLQQTRLLFLMKSRLRKQMISLYSTLRHSCTQLMASVSLELLTTNNQPQQDPPLIETSVDEKELHREVLEGYKFFYGIHCFKNYIRAFKHFVFAAERGHLEAMIMVGNIYQNGDGVEKDLSNAIAWYKRAEALGSPIAKYCLAFLILDELRVDLVHSKYHILDGNSAFSSQSHSGKNSPNSDSFIQLKSHHADQEADGGPDSEMIREEQLQRATKLLMESAEMGYTNAQTALGQLFELREEYETAKSWYELASSNGCLRAVNILGMMYYEGLGVPKLKEKAFALFEEASLGGDLCASNNVAKCLEDGIGVEQDIPAALEIYKYSADRGNAQASYSYGYLLLKSAIGDDKSPQQMRGVHGRDLETERFHVMSLRAGIKYLRSAVEGGIADAGFQLGKLYERGVGVPYDLSSAFSHYLWSSHLGHGKATLCAANMIYERYYINQQEQQQPDNYFLRNGNDETDDPQVTMNGTSIPSDLNYALQLYYEASLKGLPEAMNAYAMLIEEGNGIDFPSDVSDRDRMMEACKWYYAALESGKAESAGNLLLLLTTYPYLSFIETLDGKQIPVQDLKRWLHSYLKSSGSITNTSSVYEALKVRELAEQREHKEDRRHGGDGRGYAQEEVKDSSNAFHHDPAILPEEHATHYLYSKHRPQSNNGNQQHASSRGENKVLANLEVFPEERRDYLTNKLKTYSKFSLTSDLLARKMEYCDTDMKWNQQRDSEIHRNLLKNRSSPQRQPQKGEGVGLGRVSLYQDTEKIPNSDLKGVSTFIQMSNRFIKKPASPLENVAEAHLDVMRNESPDKRNNWSQNRQTVQERSEAKDDGNESSELDMEKMSRIRQGHHSMQKPASNGIHSQDIQELLSNSDRSEDSDLPPLTHQQDRQSRGSNSLVNDHRQKTSTKSLPSNSSSVDNLRQRKSQSYSLF